MTERQCNKTTKTAKPGYFYQHAGYFQYRKKSIQTVAQETMYSPGHTFKKAEFKTHQTTEQSG